MKKLLAVALVLIVLTPALAFAGSSTDAALGLGAFAVFNQILSGTGIFGGLVVAPPPPVVVVHPAPVVYAPPPQVVIVQPAPVYVGPRGGYYAPAPVYRHAPRPVPVVRNWCPPGHMKHGRCR
jgi:hypothetical protein